MCPLRSVISGCNALRSYERLRKVNHLSSIDIVISCNIPLIIALKDRHIMSGPVEEKSLYLFFPNWLH